MKIAIAGGSGFLGEPLTRRLVARGDDVAVLSRNPAKVEAGRGVAWDPAKPDGAWADEVAGADAVINLAGENIGDGRWSEERKRRMIASRLDSTGALVAAMRRNPAKKRTILNASAVGFYGHRGDETVDESAPRGEGFLADLVERWELAARAAEPLGRLVILRFGVVLARDGGALKKMWLPFKLGVGGPIGNGRQWMSWIDRDDAIRVVEWALDNENARGVYNVTSPVPLTGRDFARALGRAMHRPSFMPAPAFALRIAFGQLANEVLLAGQRVVPSRLLAEGFTFSNPALDDALARIVESS